MENSPEVVQYSVSLIAIFSIFKKKQIRWSYEKTLDGKKPWVGCEEDHNNHSQIHKAVKYKVAYKATVKLQQRLTYKKQKGVVS